MAKDLVRTRRYISKFYSMKTQLQAVSLRLQTLRSNQQMAEAMKGATKVRWRVGGGSFGEGRGEGKLIIHFLSLSSSSCAALLSLLSLQRHPALRNDNRPCPSCRAK